MALRFRARRSGVAIVSTLACTYVSASHAQSVSPESGHLTDMPPPAPAPQVEALAIDVEPGAAGLDPDALRTAIAREVGVPVTSAVTTGATRLLVRQDGPDGLRFELVDPGRRTVQRSVDLSNVARGSTLDTAALVAATLLEDEASGLVFALRARMVPEAPKPKAEPKPPPKPPLPNPCKLQPGQSARWFGADVAPYAGTSTFEPRGTVRHLSLEFVGSHHAGVQGVQFSPLASFGGEVLCGVQFGGLVSHTSGSATGVQFAGLVGYQGGSTIGVGFAGLGHWTEGSVTGVSFAGLAVRTEDVTGLAGAGFFAVSRHVDGAQFSGTIAWADSLTGVQAAGVGAFSAREVKGIQVAPLTFASDVKGMQLGVFNIGGYVHGVQLGVFNIARTSDASIGLASIVTEGRTHLDAWAGTDGTMSAAIQHGSRLVHNYYGGTVSFTGDKGVTGGPLIGIGMEASGSRAFIDVDLTASLLIASGENDKLQSLYTTRIIAGLKLVPGVAIYAGPTYNVLVGRVGDSFRAHTISALEYEVSPGDSRIRMWPGLVAGVRGL